jgi:hypothetical protein
VLGGRQDVRLRRVDHHDPPLGGGLDVHVVETDACPAHDGEVGAGVEHLSGHLRGRPDDQRRGARDHLDQRVVVQPHPDVHHMAGVTELLEPAVGDLLGDEDARHYEESTSRSETDAISSCESAVGRRR